MSCVDSQSFDADLLNQMDRLSDIPFGVTDDDSNNVKIRNGQTSLERHQEESLGLKTLIQDDNRLLRWEVKQKSPWVRFDVPFKTSSKRRWLQGFWTAGLFNDYFQCLWEGQTLSKKRHSHFDSMTRRRHRKRGEEHSLSFKTSREKRNGLSLFL